MECGLMKLQSYQPQEKLNTINGQVAAAGNSISYGADVSGTSALQNALNKASDTWLAIDRQNDQVKALAANDEFIRYSNDLLHNTKTGLMNQKGMNAQTILPTYVDSIKKKRQELMEKYEFKTTDAVNAFNKMADSTTTTNIDGIDKYQRGQFEESIKTQNNNTIETLSNTLQLTDDIDAQTKLLDVMGNHIETTGKMLGNDAAQIQSAKSQLYNMQAQTLLSQSQTENNLNKMDKYLSYFTGKVDETVLRPFRNVSKKMNEAQWANNTEQFEYIYSMNRNNPEMGAKMAAEAARARAQENGSSGVEVANQNLWNVAQTLQRKYNIDAALVYEQMMFETGGGDSPVSKYHNYGGLKTTQNTGVDVPENEKEGPGGLNWYATFNSDEEYADEIAKTLIADGLQGVHDRHTFVQNLANNGYWDVGKLPISDYEAGMASHTPKKKALTEAELDSIAKQASDNYLAFFSKKRQMEDVQMKARLQTLEVAVNDAVANGDYATANALVENAEAAAQTPEEKAAISGMRVKTKAALQKQIAETQKLTPREEYELKQYAQTHSANEVLARIDEMGKVPSESFLVSIDEIQQKRGTIAGTDYSDVSVNFSGLKGAALNGAKSEYAIRLNEAQKNGYVSDYQKQEIANDVVTEHSANVSGSGFFYNDSVNVSAAVSRANNWSYVDTDNGDGTIIGYHPDGSTEVMSVDEYNRRYDLATGQS